MSRPLNPHTGQVTFGVRFSFLDILRRASVNELWGGAWNSRLPWWRSEGWGQKRTEGKQGRRGGLGSLTAPHPGKGAVCFSAAAQEEG